MCSLKGIFASRDGGVLFRNALSQYKTQYSCSHLEISKLLCLMT